MNLSTGAGTARSTLKVRTHDLYETPPVAVHGLLAVETLPHEIWEPACGPGAIVNVLRAAGHAVHATDLNPWGCPDSASGRDFLMEREAPCDCILTNPPFKLAGEFAEHALTLVTRVYFLLRLSFLESARRTDLLESGHLARVLLFRERLPMMHRHDFEGSKIGNSAQPFAWFVWDKGYSGPTEVRRISARVA